MSDVGDRSAVWTGPSVEPDRYRIPFEGERPAPVGEGGQGIVYRALREGLNGAKPVALKLLTSVGPAEFGELAARSRVIGSIRHPNVMQQVEVFLGRPLGPPASGASNDFDIVCSVAEWIPGCTLDEARRHHGALEALGWIAQVARGVDFLHRVSIAEAPFGFVHRDIQPSNVRVDEGGRAVLIDFGVTTAVLPGPMPEGIGTFGWRAPEVLGGAGDPGEASDVWAVGALAYWAIVGSPPPLEGGDVLRAILGEEFGDDARGSRARIPSHVASLLATEPDQRPRDLAGWGDELDVLVVDDVDAAS